MFDMALSARKIDSLGQVVKQYQDVDLLFMVDCTGSMQPYINQVKDTIRSMSQRLRCAYPQLKLRLGFLGYRDLWDRHQFEILPFTEDVQRFEGFVSKVLASGGDDSAEDVAGALQKAAGLSWVKQL